MSEKSPKESAGKALYLEFHKGSYTSQVIFVPAVVGLDNKVIASRVMRRVISTSHPRKTWSIFKALGEHVANPEANLERDSDGVLIKRSETPNKDFFVENLSYNSIHTIRDFTRLGWGLFKKPLVVEVSYLEMSELSSGKTPNSLVRRVLRARTGLGWGDSLFETVSA
jgi:hypothetical protein